MIDGNEYEDIISNPSKSHPNQLAIVINWRNYIYYVPFIIYEDDVTLKTIIPSRKLTKHYLKIDNNNNDKESGIR
jgi:disulfide oxidoreductase YuzD